MAVQYYGENFTICNDAKCIYCNTYEYFPNVYEMITKNFIKHLTIYNDIKCDSDVKLISYKREMVDIQNHIRHFKIHNMHIKCVNCKKDEKNINISYKNYDTIGDEIKALLCEHEKIFIEVFACRYNKSIKIYDKNTKKSDEPVVEIIYTNSIPIINDEPVINTENNECNICKILNSVDHKFRILGKNNVIDENGCKVLLCSHMKEETEHIINYFTN